MGQPVEGEGGQSASPPRVSRLWDRFKSSAVQANLAEIDWMRIGTAGARWTTVRERFLSLTRSALEHRDVERAGKDDDDAGSDARRAARQHTYHKRTQSEEGGVSKADSLRSQFPPAWEHGWSMRVCDAADTFDAKHQQTTHEAKQVLHRIGGRTRAELNREQASPLPCARPPAPPPSLASMLTSPPSPPSPHPFPCPRAAKARRWPFRSLFTAASSTCSPSCFARLICRRMRAARSSSP